jgi:hypothetical protein
MRRIIFVAACIIAGLLSPVCHAYSGGTGTSADPYQIATKADFMSLAGQTKDYYKCFILTVDIDLEGEVFTTAVIIPDTTDDFLVPDPGFVGKFDGNNHIISNLTINSNTGQNVGLFDRISYSGQVLNLGLENIDIIGFSCVGGLAGQSSGQISNCYATGTVQGGDNSYSCGGLVGVNSGYMDNCNSNANVSGDTNIGGLAGENYFANISNSYSEGFINGQWYTGGLVGGNEFGNITTSFSAAITIGQENVGGLAGGNSGHISDCYSTNTVSGNISIGGLVGSDYGIIDNCYSTGVVTGQENIGGLVGNTIECMVNNSFWDIESSGMTVSACGMGKTTDQMQTPATFTDAGWDFSALDGNGAKWFISEIQYPCLIWQLNITIPDIVGWTQTDALTNLANLGLTPVVTQLAGSSIPAGTVISQSPAAGLSVSGGTIINLVVSIGSRYARGMGTSQDPYLIATSEELNNIGLDYDNSDKCFRLETDIDMSAYIPYTDDQGNIINTFNYISVFSGVFDGNGHIVRNITYMTSNAGACGMFGVMSGTIKNLGLEKVYISAAEMTGTLAGYNDSGTITNCYAIDSDVHSGDHSGGLVGVNYHGTIEDSYSSVSVSGSGYIGGLAGENSGSITRCYNTGTVTGSGMFVGGLTGANYQALVTSCYNTGNVKGNAFVGGLAGHEYESEVNNSYNTGAVDGICDIGGLIGYNDDSEVSYSYNTGFISGDWETGGLIGGNYHYTDVKYCFWNIETSGQIDSGENIGRITAEMKILSTYTEFDWDFIATWTICEGMNYPRLRWMKSPGYIAARTGLTWKTLW